MIKRNKILPFRGIRHECSDCHETTHIDRMQLIRGARIRCSKCGRPLNIPSQVWHDAEPTSFSTRFTILAGTKVFIQPILDCSKPWKEYKTKKQLGFDRFEASRNYMVTFRDSGYFIKVNWSNVKR
jgi:hypothetical protein